MRWTDWYTDELFTDSWGSDPRIRYLVGTVSRFDCDLERLENDPLEGVNAEGKDEAKAEEEEPAVAEAAEEEEAPKAAPKKTSSKAKKGEAK